MANASTGRAAIRLVARVTCPHCWNSFPPDRALWIAQHPDLIGDPRLGADQPLRFLPTRFNVDGAAIDSRGFPCHVLACPNCHLPVPRALFEMEPMFVSILGAPACGKSYFLASMTWQLRQVLPKHFAIMFGDADPLSNNRLHEYEQLQFLNPNPNALVAIDKTATQGDLYDTVLFGEQAISFPRPFLFTIKPTELHPNQGAAGRLSRVLCLYDNAGESFLPGQDTAASPVTRHLALSRCLMFLFDPTQDPRFRRACHGKTDDPQMQDRSRLLQRELPVRQETILLEAAQRVRRYAGLAEKAKHSRPLILVVTKYDCWSSLLGNQRLESPWKRGSKSDLCAMQIDTVDEVSKQLRALLWELCPEIVSAAEGFAEQVIYVPVSATGRSPEVDPQTGAFGVRPRDMNPMWAETPLLYALCRWMPGLIPYWRPNGSPVAPSHDGNGSVPLTRSAERAESPSPLDVAHGRPSPARGEGNTAAGMNVMPPTVVPVAKFAKPPID